MNKKIAFTSTLSALMALPAAALAFTPGPVPNTVTSINILGLVDLVFSILWPITVAFFIIMFVLASYLFATARDPEKVKQARNAVIWGIVGVFVALIAFSIVFIIRNLLPGV